MGELLTCTECPGLVSERARDHQMPRERQTRMDFPVCEWHLEKKALGTMPEIRDPDACPGTGESCPGPDHWVLCDHCGETMEKRHRKPSWRPEPEDPKPEAWIFQHGEHGKIDDQEYRHDCGGSIRGVS